MGQIGNLFQLLGLFAGFAAFGMYVYAMQTKSKSYSKMADWFMITQAACTTLASMVLVYALATGYFKMEYVAQYTDSALPFIYKISGWWAGQAGSLLFWGWLITVYALIEVIRLKNYDTKHRSAVLAVSALTATFFLILTVFVTSPFQELDFFPQDGMGMNPLLQNPGMLYHPPTLFLGFVGFTIVAGHSFGALVSREASAFWAVDTRRWLIITWIFLTIGIVLGGEWAYVELGWGGYWAWDPVENASLLPWLTSTALLHSIVIFERRGKLKIWSHMLILISFQMCLFGTFITRSGVLDSVHAFGKSSLGYFFLVFMIGTTIIFIAYLIPMAKKLSENEDKHFNFSSREGVFFLANWFFVGLTLVIVIGTMMPIISGLFLPEKITVGIPYYNKVSSPFFLLILLASGIAPLLSYSKTESGTIIKKMLPSAVIGIFAMAAMYVFGYTQPLSVILTGVTTFSFVTILIQITVNVRKSGAKVLLSNRRYYGGLIVHIGVVLMAYGIIASSFYNYQVDRVLAPGESFKFEEYTLQVADVQFKQRKNYTSAYAPVRVFKDGKKLYTLAPERRFYDKNQEAFAEVAIRSSLKGDLYLILSSYSKNENYVGIQAVYQPLIAWVWIGCIVMVLGGIYGISGRKKQNV
ncbi:cytochrome c assembly protein [Denitrovibrio acetiphilus DSM 12809]|uniref:Cytochrome c assembly protein n=1 Tax=Denitrovibrio acetiphilus (strain DSM 12809 / NBRC 114555 / N2460) TaxID=522772 RepID=D4H2S2_DENA2|nr:heme lyase CcmF/NrfE family subunit [Denitrovibrio acetiphilus]ADD67133.1 cytochrome c assembly protein [Denitrovibrio acetiphilus DSM 12809]